MSTSPLSPLASSSGNSANSLSPGPFHALQKQMDWPLIIKHALSEGGEWADIFWERKTTNRLVLHDKIIKDLNSSFDEGVGIRILVNGRTIFGYTNRMTPESLTELAIKLSKSVRTSQKSIYAPQALSTITSQVITPLSEGIASTSLEKKIKLINSVDAPCWNTAIGIKHVKLALADIHRQTFIVRSDSKQAFDDQTQLLLIAQVFGQSPSGESFSSNQRVGGYWDWKKLSEIAPDTLANKAHRQLNVLYKSKPAPSGTMPVILSGIAGGVMCHEAVGHGLEADAAREGLSAYSDQQDQLVASPLITVIDEGNIAFSRGSQSLDDEGNLTQKNVLIENGILKSYMYDQRMALKTGHTSTGNGRRECYRHSPQCRMTNTYIAAGKENPESILRDTRWGLYVADMGGGQVDTTSGDFVFKVAEAYIIRNGEIAEAVRGATLTGNGPKVLKEIDRVGSDLGFEIGSCGKSGQWVPVTHGEPTVRIPMITVGGTASMKDYFNS